MLKNGKTSGRIKGQRTSEENTGREWDEKDKANESRDKKVEGWVGVVLTWSGAVRWLDEKRDQGPQKLEKEKYGQNLTVQAGLKE